MMISYDPLYKLKDRRGFLWGEIREGIRCSKGTIAKITHGQYVTMDVIDRLCEYLDCDIQDVIKHEK